MFSGFFFAKSVSEGGDLYGIWQISGGSKKIRRFLKKLAIFLKKNKVFFYLTCCFGGVGFHICTCRSIRMYVPQIPALYYMIFFLHSAFIFISLLYLCEERV